MTDETFLVIVQDPIHYDIYDSINKRIVVTLDSQANAEQLRLWMEARDFYSIDNSFFLDGQMKEKIHAAMGGE